MTHKTTTRRPIGDAVPPTTTACLIGMDAGVIATLDRLAIEAVPLDIERARRFALLASELRREHAARGVMR